MWYTIFLAEIDDPNDFKPVDWDEREKYPDPDARKPEDWDETQPRQSVDESASIPEGWLEDEPQVRQLSAMILYINKL